jgi:predicted HTH domain antitoxin
MTEHILTVRVPQPLLEFGFSPEQIQHRITEWLVLSLFTEEKISSGKASRLLNISRIEFLDLLKRRGIAYINYTPEELEEEFSAVRSLDLKAE